ncbi:uncharacterized protein LOC125241207 [Leguminivora glycinivorella]|uniref:uncharacterized protein LOC125241207 n=1 Tax=Leguminivora glycinivorella TaxID=1035111 RepID=UPI00200F8DAA|nr:uncharacterized protein LOC125241207 [Leguminivora glycinivorella]
MTKISIILLMALIGTSTSSYVDGFAGLRNSLLEQQVLQLLETFRGIMLTGSGDIPILDPLQVEHVHVDENIIDLPGAHVTVKDLVLHYLSTFVVDHLRISITGLLPVRYSVQFEAHIPIIIAETDEYDLYITAMNYEIFGRGDGKAEVIEPRVSGSFTFAVLSTTVSDMVVNIGLSKFEPQLTGLFHHDGANNFANAFLANLVPEIVVFYKDEISDFVSPLIQDIANQILENVSIGDLFPQFQKNKNM